MTAFEGPNRNGRGDLPTQLENHREPDSQQHPAPANGSMTSTGTSEIPPTAATFATRADIKSADRISQKQLVMVVGGLAVALLFFLFTVVTGRSQKRQTSASKQTAQAAKPVEAKPSKGSVTPVMETVRHPTPDNSSGQLGPNDIRRTRATDPKSIAPGVARSNQSSPASKRSGDGTLGSVPSFSDTQQKWEEPQPYHSSANFTQPRATEITPSSQVQQNVLKEPSLVFVRSQVQNQNGSDMKSGPDIDASPLLDMAPGTRILAKLQTQI